MTVHVGRGSVIVEDPADILFGELQRFCRRADGQGEYIPLFTMSASGLRSMSTLPGFAKRILARCDQLDIVRDERIPMPKPDLAAAVSGFPDGMGDMVISAVSAGGGTVVVPDVVGAPEMSAAIIRAHGRDALAERGTPLSVVVAGTQDRARALFKEMQRRLPDREVGLSLSWGTDCEDVIVTSYANLDDIMPSYVGVLIGCDADGVVSWARNNGMHGLHCVRNAARWGIVSTPTGEAGDLDLMVEGLFGPVVASAMYSDAVACGLAAPVTVCWVPAPKPNAPMVSAKAEVLDAIAHAENPAFVRLAADIMNGVPAETGCIFCCDDATLSKRVAAMVPGSAVVLKKMKHEDRKAMLADISAGTVRRAFATSEFFPEHADHGVVVVATSKGRSAAGARIPWHRAGDGVKPYIVEFVHAWDVHNGRDGRLAMNDLARAERYAELKFRQMRVRDMSELPFI